MTITEQVAKNIIRKLLKGEELTPNSSVGLSKSKKGILEGEADYKVDNEKKNLPPKKNLKSSPRFARRKLPKNRKKCRLELYFGQKRAFLFLDCFVFICYHILV